MTEEKRRYFRIHETIGLYYEILDHKHSDSAPDKSVDIWDLMSEQDEKIQRLLIEVEEESPKVAELIAAFNQKLERVVHQLVMESQLLDRVASRVKEVSISACGLGFMAVAPIAKGTRLRLELQLFPSTQLIHTHGRVVGCEPRKSDFYWRIEFLDMRQSEQERLIQHIVQRQSAQLQDHRRR